MMSGDGKTKVLLSKEEVSKHNSVHSCWVIYKDGVYDVTAFLHSHPGGDEILLRHAGCDITDIFEEIGHSKQAQALLKNYFVGSLGDELSLERSAEGHGNSKFSRLVDKIKQRLFTKEDRFGLHKLFGIVCIAGFLGAIWRVFQFDAEPPFFAKPTVLNIFLLSCNFGLTMTSLVFHVPVKRFFTHLGTVEHQEQRLHSIIFSLRSISFVAWYMFEPVFASFFYLADASLWIFRASLLGFWHVLADMTTHKFEGLNGTTIRGAFNDKNELNFIGSSLASIAQLGAIMILLGFTATDPFKRAYLADMCYLTLIPIQLLVFQLTLKRKGFLSDSVSGWLYMLELGVVAVAVNPGSREMFLIFAYGFARFIMHWNKYALFFAFAFLAEHFAYVIHPGVSLALGVLLLILMRRQSRVQCFRGPTTVPCSIVQKTKLHENAYHLELKIPDGYAYKMPSGRHLALHIDDKTQRFYTPISYSSDGGKFEILAKTNPNGRANALIAGTNLGDVLTFSGPYGNIFYAKNKALRIGEETISLKDKSLLCIAGGSGITPIYSILTNLPKKTKADLIYINRTKKDILLHEKIINLPKNIHTSYFLTKEGENESWFNSSYYRPERIGADIVLISGPPQFCESYKNLVSQLNSSTKVFVFE